MTELPLNQVAMSVRSVQHTQRWYRDVFGFVEGGGTPAFIPQLGAADVQGVPEATSECWWLLDAQEFFQIELFEFRKPTPRPLPDDWRPCDIGYTMVGIHVGDFDAVLDRLARRNVALLTEPMGGAGDRRVCVRDPDGVLLEVMEDDPRAAVQRDRVRDLPVATRFVTLSVPDLKEARTTWLDVLGLSEEADVVLHTPEHEALWGLAGASRDSFLARAGDLFLEVVQYHDPVGRPWPEGYRISDLGLLNVALGLREEKQHDALVRHCAEHRLRPNSTKPTLLKKLWYAVYVNDPMGFSIELLYHKRAGRHEIVNPLDLLELGFAPHPAPVTRVSARALSAAPPERVWEVLVGGPTRPTVIERVVAAEAPYRFEYTAQGAPLQWMYHGFVTLEPTAGGGTSVLWEAQFRSPVWGLGTITRRRLQRLVSGLVQAAERPAVAG